MKSARQLHLASCWDGTGDLAQRHVFAFELDFELDDLGFELELSGEQRLAQPAQQIAARFTKRRIVLPGILPELTMRRRRGRPRR